MRSLMLWLGRWLPRFPEWMIGLMTWLERRQPRRLRSYYRLALDYFFWVGARSTLREAERPDLQRMRIGLCLLVLFALVSNLRLLVRELHEFAHTAPPDEITRNEARFRELRQVLPPLTEIGYLTDDPPLGAGGDEAPRLAFKQYLLTQYALLPTIVLPGIHGAFAVGNFDSAGGTDSRATSGRTLVRDFGDGVMLFRTSAE